MAVIRRAAKPPAKSAWDSAFQILSCMKAPMSLPSATDPIEPASPCVDVCTMDKDIGLCLGCLRTLDEIAGWRRFTAVEKQAVLDRLPPRHAALEKSAQ